MDNETSLYGGWPMTPVKRFGQIELGLQCPKCNSRDITLKGEPCGRGTGPGGRWRQGDPQRSLALCNCCGNKGYHQGQA